MRRSGLTLERDLRDLLGTGRNARIAARYEGCDGRGGETVQTVGSEIGLTRRSAFIASLSEATSCRHYLWAAGTSSGIGAQFEQDRGGIRQSGERLASASARAGCLALGPNPIGRCVPALSVTPDSSNFGVRHRTGWAQGARISCVLVA